MAQARDNPSLLRPQHEGGKPTRLVQTTAEGLCDPRTAALCCHGRGLNAAANHTQPKARLQYSLDSLRYLSTYTLQRVVSFNILWVSIGRLASEVNRARTRAPVTNGALDLSRLSQTSGSLTLVGADSCSTVSSKPTTTAGNTAKN